MDTRPTIAEATEVNLPPRHPMATGYQPLPGVPDEMIDASGQVRPVWNKLLAAFERLGPEALGQRFSRADQYLRDAGVYYRVYGDQSGREREWPLSHVPLLIDEQEWAGISAGLVQRAELLEAICADIHGPNELVKKGLLPPALVAGNPEFLRPMAGVQPAGGHFLHFCAFELGRGPDGQWWVLGDRTQAPSGAGFALENRVATMRALSEAYGELHIHRLAGFFKRFRDHLIGLADGVAGNVAILSPGQMNETYFEHAYIARYLGFMLLEGDDIAVRDGKAMVRTVSGLQPLGVLWRRMDAAFVDPLELNHASQIGTPGLVEALRRQHTVMVNALGSGMLETRAMLAFMPRLCEALRGETLVLPSIATWWCGGESQRNHVIGAIDQMMIGPAMSTSLPYDDDSRTVLGARLPAAQKDALIRHLRERGRDFAGQEAVTLSTTPVWANGRLEPRPVALRVFAARTEEGWTVLPGGFARVGTSLDIRAIAMQRGGQAGDVWIVSNKPVEKVTLLPQGNDRFSRNRPAALPARAADNLFWLGRYIERAEDTVRILRAYHARLAEIDEPDHPLIDDIGGYLDLLDVDAKETIPNGLIFSVNAALGSAAQIRDRFSPDGWLALRDLAKTLREFREKVQPGDDATRAMTIILRKLAGFSGLVHENMYRSMGWRFLEIGRRLERAIHLARFLGHAVREDAPDGSLDLALEVGDSVMTHRRQYSVTSGPVTIIDLLALDGLNPRSILFQLNALKTELELLPGGSEHGRPSDIGRLVLSLHTKLAVADPSALPASQLTSLSYEIAGLSEALSRVYLN